MSNSIHNCSVNSIPQCQQGGVAPLDLINGHLRTKEEISDSIPLNDPQFIPLEHNSKIYASWLKRPETEYNPNPLVLKIQPLESGGYEATIRNVDINKLAGVMDGVGKKSNSLAKKIADEMRGMLNKSRALNDDCFTCKEELERMEKQAGEQKKVVIEVVKREKREQNENDVIRSKQRSKTKVRHLIKSMGCDRLITFTRRESDEEEFWGLDQWVAAWKRFCRLCDKAGCKFEYVCVPERHKKGNFHLHAAAVGHAPIDLIRRLWYISLGGKGDEKKGATPGNVDVSYRKDLSVHQRRSGVAKYISKYITKQDSAEFNKKRYWASRHKLPKPVRYILEAENIWQAIREVAGMLGLDDMVLGNPKNIFIFPNWLGAWFSFEERFLMPVPF
jgi:hypothetical protein